MIDRIRHDIQERLDQLLSEADRLRHALAALGGESERGGTAARAGDGDSDGAGASRTRSRAGSSSRTRSPGAASRSRSSNGGGSSRAAAGGTKNAVLHALADADGGAMTATEVAAATGLGRASVSTTLSKLARAGEVTKASRGYQLAAGGNGGGPATTDEAAIDTATAEA